MAEGTRQTRKPLLQCGRVVQLIRTPACHARGGRSRDTAATSANGRFSVCSTTPGIVARLIKKIFDVDPQIADCHRNRAAAVSWPPGSSGNPLGLPQPQALANTTYRLGLCITFMTLTLFYISRETPIPL